MTGADRQLIWMAGVSWDGIRGTDRHMATAMTRHARILWVDPPISPLTPARWRYASGRRLWPALSLVNDRLARLTPVALPGHSRVGVRTTTAALMRSQVRWAMRRLDIRPAAVVATYLDDLLGYWGADVVNVLYGTDDYVAGAELMGVSARHLRRQEPRALARADVVAAVSPELVGRWTSMGASPELIPNGCWPTPVGRVMATEAVNLPPPIAGLVGQLSDRIDLDVLFAVARGGISLLLVGPMDPRWDQQRRISELTNMPNVQYTGAVPAEAVPSYLAAVDVGITPYKNTPFNRASFPLKTVEYLAAGLPVVSADLPTARWLLADLANHGETVRADQVLALAETNAEFVAAIRRMAAESSQLIGSRNEMRTPRQIQAADCIAFAGRHSWHHRADALAVAIGLD